MSDPDPVAEPQHRKIGKYELIDKIGTGGMAEIYKARVSGPEGFQKILVVKKILPAFAKNKAFIDMLIAEAKLTSLLQHGNIVQLYEFNSIDGQYYIVMEFVDGADLLKILAASTKAKKRIPIELSLHIVAEMARGLAYAHSASDHEGRPLNIIHRDVSPSNVLISYDGAVKVMDFGVARADVEAGGARQRKKGGALKGKLGYMSPELVVGNEIDHRSDIFALGIIFWEILTLRRLFLGKTDVQTLVNIRDVNIERKFAKHSYIPSGIDLIIRKALTKKPGDRFATADDFAEAILDYMFENRIRVTGNRLGEFVQTLVPRGIRRRRKGPVPEAEESAVETAPSSKTAPEDADETTDAEGADPVPEDATAATDVAAVSGDTDQEEDASDPTPVDPPALIEESVTTKLPPPLTSTEAYKVAQFRVRNDEGKIFGPVTAHNLETLIRSRAMTWDEMVSVNGGPWMKLKNTGLAELDPTLFSAEEDLPLLEGPITRIRTPALAYDLAVMKANGKLRVTRGTTSKEIFFVDGVPVHITSNLRSELLANFLIERKHIDQAQLDMALDKMRQAGGRLGDALVALGVLKPHDLFRVVELQFRERFTEIFAWNQGWYEFLEGYPAPADVIPLSDDALQLSTQAIRAHFPMPVMKDIFAQYADRVLVLEQNPAISHNNLRFDSRELRLYACLETGKTLREVLEQFGRSPEDMLTIFHVVFALHQARLLSFRAPAGYGQGATR